MTINPSNAGPFSIGLEKDLPGDGSRREFNFSTIKAGPANRSGWLKKLYGEKHGLDYIYIDNGSEYRVSVEASGNKYSEVPAATSIEITGTALNNCVLSQNSGNVISAQDLTVQVGNKPRGNAQFSGKQVAADVIPGFSLSNG